MFKKIKYMGMFFILGSALGMSSPAFSAAKILKLSVSVPADHAGGMQLRRFADLVNEGSKGALDARPFYNNQLGGETEVAQGIQLGSIEGGLITTAVLSRWVPEADAFELPFIYTSDEHWHRVITSDYILDFAKRYEPHGLKVLSYTAWGSRNVMSTFSIEKPEDVVGKKMRIMQNPMHASTWEALGARPTPIPAPEIYNALQTGLADYFDNNIISWHALKFYEVAPHLTKSSHMYQPIAFIVSKRLYDGLTPELQKVLQDAARDAALYGLEISAGMVEEAQKLAAKEGGVIHELQDREAWTEKTRPVWDEWAADDSDRKAIIEAILSLQ